MKPSLSRRGVRTSEGVDLWPLRAPRASPSRRPPPMYRITGHYHSLTDPSLATSASVARRAPSGPPPHAPGAPTGHLAQPIWTPHPVIQRNRDPVTPDPRRVRRPAAHPGVRPLTPQALLDRPPTDRGTLHRMQLRALGCSSLRYGAVHGSTCTRSELRRERA